jgi:glycosyltransferase involved in cell wall biosynthesis
MVTIVRRLLREEKIELVHVDCTNLARCIYELIDEINQVPVFYDWHNIESDVMAQYSRHAGFLRKMYALTTAGRLRDLEGRLLRSAAGHIVCSEREQLALRQREPSARVEVIENGVDVAAFSRRSGDEAPRHRIVFVGSMDYHANIDACMYFGRGIWPRLRSRLPAWKLTLVGSRPTPEIVALANDPSIEVTGTVPDVRPYYREAVAAVVPLRLGGGTRLKILEAMAAGVPVISTALGAEGLEVRPGRDILIARTEQDWESALKAIRTQCCWDGLSTNGRELVSRRYDWDAIGKQLFDVYAGWMGL